MIRLFFPFRKKVVYFLLTFFCPLIVFSQSTNSLAFPSPNNTFLGAAGNINATAGVGVDLYTGTAQINLPICNLASREMSIPISISYIGAKGIRIQDYASPVGLGWALNAGGSISRVVRCFPDEQPNGYLGTGQLPSGAIGTGSQWGKVVANYLGASVAMTSSQSIAITGINGTSYNPPTADGEPDIFYVKTPFFGFQFTFDENGNPVFSNSTGIKIIASNFNNSTNYYNSSFEVIDDHGNQYYFGSTSASVENTTTKLFGASYTFPTTWYLDKIVTFNSKDIITLSYISSPNNDVIYHYSGTATFDAYGNSNYDTTHPVVNTITSKYVSSIVSSIGETDFNYSFSRNDDVNAPMLQNIVLKAYNPQTQSNSSALQTFFFNFSYFGSPSTDPNVLRLKLNTITVTGNTAATSSPAILKSFTYNLSNGDLPSRKSLSYNDYWGYYNFIPGVSA